MEENKEELIIKDEVLEEQSFEETPKEEARETDASQIVVKEGTDLAPQEQKIQNLTEDTSFTRVVDQAKINVVEDATANDNKFVEDFKQKLKDATLKLAEVEKSKAELEQQNIEYHSELLETQQKLNEHTQAENKWTNREKRRQYHYNGVAPIMQFVGIKTSMNLIILYFLTVVILPFFLLNKFLRGTVGALISGAEDENRPKRVRGFLWTMLGLIFVLLLALLVYLVLGWLGIIPKVG